MVSRRCFVGLSSGIFPVCVSYAAGKRENVRLLRFWHYSTIYLTSAQHQRKVCYLNRCWKVVERYMIVMIMLMGYKLPLNGQSVTLTPFRTCYNPIINCLYCFCYILPRITLSGIACVLRHPFPQIIILQ